MRHALFLSISLLLSRTYCSRLAAPPAVAHASQTQTQTLSLSLSLSYSSQLAAPPADAHACHGRRGEELIFSDVHRTRGFPGSANPR
jgi:hypothetical protein